MRCDLCGRTDNDVRPALMAWKPEYATSGRPFDTGPRCDDHAACRTRVEAGDETWPLLEVEKSHAR